MKFVSLPLRHPRSGFTGAPLQVLAVVILALGGGVAASHWLSEGRSEKFYGYAHPRMTTIAAPRSGVISTIEIRDGDFVEPGSLIARLADDNLERRFEAKQGQIASMEAELMRSQAQAELDLDWRLRDLDSDICELQLLAATYQKERYDFELRKSMLSDSLASNQFAMLGGNDEFMGSLLREQGESSEDRMVTVLRLEAAENAAEVSQAQIEWCAWNKARLEKLRGRLPDVVKRSAGVDVLNAQLVQAKRELQQIKGERDQLDIKSPAIGRIGVMRITAGSAVNPGGAIVDILDDIEREVVVLAPSEKILLFRSGEKVGVTFAGKEQREGRIVKIAPQAQTKNDEVGGESFVEVRIQQVGEMWPQVPAGSRVSVRL
jgi:multidrug resistance efflux pump